jgi:hypothetical protein
MDKWLTDEIKELLFRPCLLIGERIGQRLDSRVRMQQNIDERALTEELVDALDTNSAISAWGQVLHSLRNNQIYLNTRVRKSTREYKTGADLGIIINRQIYRPNAKVKARYACLIQCKKVDIDGYVTDFFHYVHSRNKSQSSLMLEITPSSFYFTFVPPSLLQVYYTIEPMAFVRASSECSSPIWNIGCFAYSTAAFPFLSDSQKRAASSILVIPALAVEAQIDRKHKIDMVELLPNSLPLWYWFGELLIPGFIGDYREKVISIAANVDREVDEFGVDFSVEIYVGTG